MTPLAPPLCALHLSHPQAVLIRGTRLGMSSCTPSASLNKNSTRAWVPQWLVPFPAVCVSQQSGLRNDQDWRCGFERRSAIGVGFTCSSSTSPRSVELDVIMKKSTAVGFRLLLRGRWAASAECYGIDGLVFGAAVALAALGDGT